MQDFIDFIKEQGVVGLAIGFIMGGSVAKLVTSLVNDVVQPLIAPLLGTKQGFMTWQMGPVLIGSFLVNLIDFVIICILVFAAFKLLRLDRLHHKKT